MKRREFITGAAVVAAAALINPVKTLAFPSVFPHGTTIYKPEKCWSGYTVFGTEVESEGTVLIDMNGNVVKQWKDICQAEHPPKMLKGGYLAGAKRPAPDKKGRVWGDPSSTDLVIVDWNDKVVRNIPRAGLHHDYQFQGNPVGYHVPGMPLDNYKGNVLVLSHKFTHNQYISDKELYDDYLVEVDAAGNVIWEWVASEHFDEMEFPLDFKKTMYKFPTYSMTRTPGRKGGDWIHVNAAPYLGPNKWWDEDPKKYAVFNPENIIISCRQTNTNFIIEKKTGKVVWQVGPEFYRDSVWEFGGKKYKRALYKLGQIIGQHHTHMIPKGLPGEGNILVYDNGGYAGYGKRNPGAPPGMVRRPARLLPRHRIRSAYAQGGLGTLRQADAHAQQVPVLLGLRQLGPAPAQRQHADHERRGGTVPGSDSGSRSRLGIHQPLLQQKRQLQPGVPHHACAV